MADLAPLFVSLSPDRARVLLSKGTWRGDFPVAQLGRWIGTYRALRDRRSGRFAKHYADDVAALEAVRREIEEDPT